MMQRSLHRAVIVAAVVVLTGAAVAAQFVTHAPFGFDRGQEVIPTFDGWVRNPDGSYSLYFGYLNRNAAESLVIPVGPENSVAPGADRGQPTYFYPAAILNQGDRDVVGRRRWWVFKVDVPSSWTVKERLTWTIVSRGKTNRAVGSLLPEYEVANDFIRENAADPFLFSRGEFDTVNVPPRIAVTGAPSVALPATTTLTASIVDDDRPALAATARRAAQRGVRVRWMTYRGPAPVRFSADTATSTDQKTHQLATIATFSVPGSYRIRAIVSDGQLFSSHDLDVTVTAASTQR